jgi:hypothetical protein
MNQRNERIVTAGLCSKGEAGSPDGEYRYAKTLSPGTCPQVAHTQRGLVETQAKACEKNDSQQWKSGYPQDIPTRDSMTVTQST